MSTHNSMSIQVSSFGLTDKGCQRTVNEDQYLLSELNQLITSTQSSRENYLKSDRLMLLAVADGLSGHQGGAIASELAVDSLARFAQQHEFEIRDCEAAWKLANLIRKGILTAAEQIKTLAANHTHKHGMATTLTAALIRYPDLVIGHVGASRCYLYRGGSLIRLTNDHTLEAMFHEHALSATNNSVDSVEPVESAPMSNVLWNCLGGNNSNINVESHLVKLEPNDWIVLATDGLTRHVHDDEIKRTIELSHSPRHLSKILKAIAIERGGKDNVTIVACHLTTPSKIDVEQPYPNTERRPRGTLGGPPWKGQFDLNRAGSSAHPSGV